MTGIKLGTPLLLMLPLVIFAASCAGDNTASPTPISPETATASAKPDISALHIPDPYELHVAAADGSGDKTIFATDQSISYALSPDSSQIAVSEGTYNSATVHFINFDGIERARATYNGGSEGQLEWSPDGRYLVSTFNAAGSQTLVAFSSDGSSQKQLLTSSSSASVLLSGWLPDGELLLEKSRTASGGADLLAFDLGAGTSRTLTDLNIWKDYFGQPAVSPDGKAVAVLSPGGAAACGSITTSTTIWTIDLASGASTQITPDGFCGSGGMVWSPDGAQLAYSAMTTADVSTLNVLDVATGQSRTATHGLDNVIAWLPDGTLLADEYNCINCDGGVLHLFAVNASSGARRDLTASASSAVSPYGRIVTADGAVKTLDASGGQFAVLAPQESGWGYSSFAWTGDESHITYLRFHNSGTRFFEVNRDGSGFQQTVYNTEAKPQISPDGSRIAYFVSTSTPDGKATSALWLANADGSNAIQVSVGGSPSTIAWAPDSTRLLFLTVAGPGEPGSPYVVDADGSGVRQVSTQTLSIGVKDAGLWAPNGKLVVFADAPMTVLNVDSGDTTSVSPGTPKGMPAWSADSSKLIYPVFNSQGGTDIYVSNVDGSGTTQIPGGANSLSGFAASSDGSKIAYISVQGDKTGLVIANIDGSDKISVLDGASLGGGGPSWSPDGNWLAVVATSGESSGLFVVRADGSGVQQLARSQTVAGIWWIGNDRLRIETFLGGL
jgi:TolB protein